MTIVDFAERFAYFCHRNQKRKYTNEPYFAHCKEVADLVASIGGTEEMIAAAFLHDVIEDCGVTYNDLCNLFNISIANLVLELTDQSTKSDGNRAIRKAKDREHLSRASKEAKSIKLADLISNTKSIVQYDPNFAKVYLREKELLLPLLVEGDVELHKQAADLLLQGILQLKMSTQ